VFAQLFVVRSSENRQWVVKGLARTAMPPPYISPCRSGELAVVTDRHRSRGQAVIRSRNCDRQERVGCTSSIREKLPLDEQNALASVELRMTAMGERLPLSVLIDERRRLHFVTGRSECRVESARKAGGGRLP